MSKPIYLDYAAATPLDDEALSAMEPYLSDLFYNPSAVYQAARQVYQDLENARVAVAHVLGCRQQEVYFMAGGTEANNLAIRSIMVCQPDGHIVVSSVEHESILETIREFPHTIVPVDKNGIVNIEDLEAAITDKTVLVSIMYANNEIGSIQPIKEISSRLQLIRNMRRESQSNESPYPIYLHTDACQAANYLDLQVTRLGVDLMTLNGGKIYGPKQSGALFVKRGVELRSVLTGGGQESGLRSGTENVAYSIGFATALQKTQNLRKTESQRLLKIRDKYFAMISQNVTNLKLNGHAKKRLPNNLNITISGIDGERLLMELDEAGLMVATGSACTASNDEPSHVLLALGLSLGEAAASLRMTLGRHTNDEDLSRAADILSSVVKKHKMLQ